MKYCRCKITNYKSRQYVLCFVILTTLCSQLTETGTRDWDKESLRQGLPCITHVRESRGLWVIGGALLPCVMFIVLVLSQVQEVFNL